SIMNALARCLSGLEQPKQALLVIQSALEIDPDHADTHASKGRALEQLGQLIAAEESYRRALELWPEHIGAKAGLASLCNQDGARAEAREMAQAVLDVAPDHAQAALILAMAELAEGSPHIAEARIRQLMASPHPAPLLAGYLGDALDAQGRT